MAQLNIFKKKRQKNQIEKDKLQTNSSYEPKETCEEEQFEEEITEYNETLYTSNHPNYKKSDNRYRWESSSTIESKVDGIDTKKPRFKQKSGKTQDIENKVDKLLKKKHMIPPKKTTSLKIPNEYKAKVNKKTGLTYYTKK